MGTFFRCGLFLIIVSISISGGVHEVFCSEAPKRELRIGMLLWRGETEAEKGFRARLEELNYKIEFKVYDAGQDIKKLGQILLKLNSQLTEFDYIYTFGTTVSRRAKVVINNKVAQVFNVVTDPVGAGIVQSLEIPGGNISGVSDAIPVAFQLESARLLFDFKKLALLFNPREKNSMLIRRELNDYAEKHSIEIVDLRCPPTPDILTKRLNELAENKWGVDAVYLPPDSFMVSSAGVIGEYLQNMHMKSIGSVELFIDKGVLFGVVVDYHHLGELAAEILHQHQGGKNLGTIPVRRDGQTSLLINRDTAKALDISIPEKLKHRMTGGSS